MHGEQTSIMSINYDSFVESSSFRVCVLTQNCKLLAKSKSKKSWELAVMEYREEGKCYGMDFGAWMICLIIK